MIKQHFDCCESWLTGSWAITCNWLPLSFLQLCLWGLSVDTVLHGLLHPLHCRAFKIHLKLAGVLLMLQRHKDSCRVPMQSAWQPVATITSLAHKVHSLVAMQRQMLWLNSVTNGKHTYVEAREHKCHQRGFQIPHLEDNKWQLQSMRSHSPAK